MTTTMVAADSTTIASSTTSSCSSKLPKPKQTDPKFLKHKRRLCQEEGCTRIVKSQRRCQRHGAKPKSCKIQDCNKQAQGNFDGMCKAHFHQAFTAPVVVAAAAVVVVSVYEEIIPECIRWTQGTGRPFPLVHHLQSHFHRGTAWHRNDERLARGLNAITSPSTQLESWERELVWTETLLLTGHPRVTFRHLARAWGRDKGFHRVLAHYICERHGSVERKRKVDDTESSSNNKKPTTHIVPKTITVTTETLPVLTATEKSSSASKPETAAADIWDSTAYYGTEYSEALAATLLDFVDKDGSPTTESTLQENEVQPSEMNQEDAMEQ